jgi:tetratricopeptide (TPR) repeat protein
VIERSRRSAHSSHAMPDSSRRSWPARSQLLWGSIAAAAVLAVTAVLAYPRVEAHLHWRAAEVATRREDFESAQAHLALCIRARPEEPTYLFAAARLARRESDLSRAQALLAQAAAAGHPANEVRLEELLITVRQFGWRGNDTPLLALLPDAGPNRARIHEVLARAYFRDYLLGPALEQAEAWCGEEPWSGLAWLLTGDVRLRLLRNESATDAYRTAVELNPDLLRARVGYAAGLMKGRQLAEAEEQYRAALRINPIDRDALLGLAQVLFERGDVEARTVVGPLPAYFPGDPEVAGTAGRIALKAGEYENAERLLRVAAAQSSDRAVLQDFQRCLVRSGKTAEAKEVDVRLDRVHKDLGRVQELTRVASESLDPAPRVEIAQILIRNEQWTGAVAWLNDALRCGPGYKPAHAALADCLEAVGRVKEAAYHRGQAAGP